MYDNECQSKKNMNEDKIARCDDFNFREKSYRKHNTVITKFVTTHLT